jgi:hypothetical protein
MKDGTIVPYDPTVFSPGSAGALGRCSWENVSRRRHGPDAYRCGTPVAMEWRTRLRGGAWYSLCYHCALNRKGN